ncbi:MAG: alpha/beta hydrolase [Verrucomicrobia bacterium]|nr:alpha/beta hydrolase [Verrucomicrobiota bacterium]
MAARIAAARCPPLVIGWSMGGIVALDALTSDSPPSTAGLVLVASTPRFCTTADWPWGQTPAALRALRAGLRRDPRRALRGFLAGCAQPDSIGADALDPRIDAALALGLLQLVAGLDYLESTDLRGRPVRPEPRTVCIHGETDRIVPCQASEVLARNRTGFLEVLTGSGHSVPVTSPHRVADAIRRSLRACVPPQPWNR